MPPLVYSSPRKLDIQKLGSSLSLKSSFSRRGYCLHCRSFALSYHYIVRIAIDRRCVMLWSHHCRFILFNHRIVAAPCRIIASSSLSSRLIIALPHGHRLIARIAAILPQYRHSSLRIADLNFSYERRRFRAFADLASNFIIFKISRINCAPGLCAQISRTPELCA